MIKSPYPAAIREAIETLLRRARWLEKRAESSPFNLTFDKQECAAIKRIAAWVANRKD